MEKRLFSGFLAIVTAIFLFSSLGSCSKDEDLEISVASVSISQTSLSLEIGATASLTATVSPSDATNKTVSWTSSNSTVATVSNGVVTAVSEGSATITAMAGGKSASCLVTVKAKAEEKVLVVGNAATVPAAGATVEVDIQYNVEYTVEIEASAQSWIHYVETRAVQSGKLVFKVDANDGEKRSGKVTLKDKSGTVDPVTITITQEPEDKVLVVGDAATVSAEGATIEVDVQYNVEYTVEIEASAQSWIHYVETRAVQSGKLVFKVDANDGEQRSGKVTLKDKSGTIDPVTITITQEMPDAEDSIKSILMEFYNEMNGPKWADNEGWGTDAPLEKWSHITYKQGVGVTHIGFMYDHSIKGKIPSSIGELTSLTEFTIWDAPDVTGPLPESFKNLVNLERFQIIGTSMTSIPDIFGGMQRLEWVQINGNDKLACPLPTSIGDSPAMNLLHLVSNRFTGEIPASWSRFGTELSVGDNCLSGVVPEAILSIGENNVRWLIDDILFQKTGYGFDIANLELHGGYFWPDGPVDDLNGKRFSFDEVIAKNKYTVYLYWATWCPFSKVLMPQLKEYYDQYHNAGLEIIATIAAGDSSGSAISLEDHRRAVNENGCGGWYNFYLWQQERDYYPNRTPVAEVYDSDGTILFSSFTDLDDPVRNRFGQTTSSDLIPFLETLLGPADVSEVYTSTDFSKDGEVMTLQKATVGKGINIVFLGDAYTDKDMNEGGLYETVMKESMEEFFAIEPYKTFRNRFNVYAVKAVSTNDRIGDGYSTALSCYFGNGTTVLGSDDACYAYALKVPGITNQENLLICTMVNSTVSKGTTSMSYMRKSSVAYTTTIGNYAELFGDVLRHEAGGHGFAFLADEYSNVFDYAPTDHIKHYTEMYEQYGWFSNVDFTSDRDKIRWSAFLKDSRYADQVGIYEGGALYSKGVWRPTKNSIMNENIGDFNAPSRWAIYQRIMKLSGEECSFEKFLEYDVVNRSASAAASKQSMKGAANRLIEHSAPPVVVP